MSEYTEKQLDQIFNIKVIPALFLEATPVKNPKAYILGGQPGAGKSSLYEIAELEQKENYIPINGDEYRQYHPKAKDFEKEYKEQASVHTQEFAGEMVRRALTKAITEKYNFLVEGTFRTIEAPLSVLKHAKENGFQTAVYIKTCSHIVSYTSTLERYHKLAITGEHTRATPTDHHDKVVASFADNIEKVFNQKLHNEFKVFNRSRQLFDDKIHLHNKLKSIIQTELYRTLTNEELKNVKENIEKFNSIVPDYKQKELNTLLESNIR